MKKLLLFTLIVPAFFMAMPCSAQDTNDLIVEELSFCRAIEDREPVEVDTIFLNIVGRVYCFTKITGAVEPVTISHVWYLNDQETARTVLEIKSKNWRTWSSKKILKGWMGNWRVDVVSSDGVVLAGKEFTVTDSPE